MRLLVGGALLITAVALPASKTSAQQLFFPWVPTTTTQASGTVTLGNTFQTVLASNTSRRGCIIQNQSTHVMFVFMGTLASATAAKSYQLTALGGARDTFYCNQGPIVMTDNVNVTTSTTSDAFVVLSF